MPISKAVVSPYRYTWDSEASVYVVACKLTIWRDGEKYAEDNDHPIATQGTTMAEARRAMDSAVDLTIKNWPPRKS
jgi:hypothetical protein